MATAAMMAEPSPTGLDWRCFGYPYIYNIYIYIRINSINIVFFNSKIVFVFFVPGFGFDFQPQMVDSGRLVSQCLKTVDVLHLVGDGEHDCKMMG